MSLDGEESSGSPKPRCEVSCQGLHGPVVVIAVLLKIRLGHQAALSHISALSPYGALRVVTFLLQFVWNNNDNRIKV
jgi:hypothetical protein